MTDSLLHLLVLVGAILIAAGCSRPLNVAVATANAAAVGLQVTRDAIVEQRKTEQIAAARRVRGDRSDPAVRAEQLDRATEVGRRYRKAWDVYDSARDAWMAAAAGIRMARELEDAGAKGDVAEVAMLLRLLAISQQQLLTVAHEVAGVLGDGPPPSGGETDGR